MQNVIFPRNTPFKVSNNVQTRVNGRCQITLIQVSESLQFSVDRPSETVQQVSTHITNTLFVESFLQSEEIRSS